MQIKKIQKNKEKGFVILFAVVVTSILLTISLSIADISFREIKFYTAVRESNNAFFNADTGAECALMNDKSTSGVFLVSGGSGVVDCLGRNNIPVSGQYPLWNFVLSGLGDGQNPKGCAIVSVNKSGSNTVVVSRGYNEGGTTLNACSPSVTTLERQIRLTY